MPNVNEPQEKKPTAQGSCFDCVYATWNPVQWMRSMAGGWPSGLTCANRDDAPGYLRDVTLCRPCRNFCERPAPVVRPMERKPTDDGICYLPLTQNQYAIIDAADYERVSQHKWCASRQGNKFYASCHDGRKTVLMHRFLMNPPKGMVVDHIDGNSLNNRRSNLRICTPQQNTFNRRGRSEFKGVHPYGKGLRREAAIQKDGETIYLGTYDDPVEAAKAYDLAARRHHGEHAWLNFPRGRVPGQKTEDAGQRTENGKQTPATDFQQPAPSPAPPATRHRLVRMPIWPSPKSKTQPPQDAGDAMKSETKEGQREPENGGQQATGGKQ